jgi:transcription elongation factor/antiterminator RfaH
MEQWYTIHTKPNAEYQVATTFRYRRIETYLPEIRVPQAQRGRERKPFFPCYLFVKADFELVGLSHLQGTPGLRRIVAFDDQPVSFDDEIIDLIRHKVDVINAAGGLWGHTFQPGDTIRIIDGPLQGMLAIFEGPNTPSERVQVLLTFLGQVSRARVPITYLEKTTPAAESPITKRLRHTRGRGRRINYQAKTVTI